MIPDLIKTFVPSTNKRSQTTLANLIMIKIVRKMEGLK